MSKNDSKDGEIIPPQVPMRATGGAIQRVDNMPSGNPDGVIGSAVTRFVAGLRRKANSALAADANARADYFDAVGRAAKSYIGMNQAINEVGELDEILALDRKERATERGEREEEIEHRKAVAEQRRKQELTEAQRGAFNSEQGYQNQQRLKQLNLETWEKRKEVEHLDATTLAARLRGETEPDKRKRGGGLLSELQSQADFLEKEILESLADGKDTESDLMVLAELKAFIARLAADKKGPQGVAGD
jgi:hypothetical protein